MLRNTNIGAFEDLIFLASENDISTPPSLAIEICRGKTSFPFRPVSTDGFTIGADQACDLQLGGGDLPGVHCVVNFDGLQYWLEAISPSPPLLINGQAESSWPVADGDIITIGAFDFVCHLESATESGVCDSTQLSQLTAADLADRIEQEQEVVEAFELGCQQGAESLLNAISQRRQVVGETTHSDVESSETILPQPTTVAPAHITDEKTVIAVLCDVEALLVDLASFAKNLEQRSDRLSSREADYAEATANLFELQQKFATQLETLLEQVQLIRERDYHRETPLRAIA